MSQDLPAPTSASPATELAKERNRAAEERTLMAWIRTCLSLISFGFGIERIVTVLHQELGDTINPLRLSRILGLAFVALGTLAMLAAAKDHRGQLQRLQNNDLLFISRRSPALIVAVILACLGGIAFLGMLLSPFLE
jgi:putative membrane protein